jgi:hypothetical protein
MDIRDEPDPAGAATRRPGQRSTRLVGTGLMTTHAAPGRISPGLRAVRSVP